MGSGVKFGFRAAPFLHDKSGRRLSCSHEQPFAGQVQRAAGGLALLRGRILMERARCGKIFSDIE